MKAFVSILKSTLFAVLVLGSTCAAADDPPAPCPPGKQCVDTIYVTATSDPGNGGGGTAPGDGSSVGAGTVAAGGTAPTTTQKVLSAAKALQCKKATDDCVTWGQQMNTPAGAPTPNGQGTGNGFCQNASVGILGVAIAICTNIINLEVNADSCLNVSCPAT